MVTAAAAVALLLLLGLAASTFLIAREQRKTAQNYALAEERFRNAQDTVERLGLHVSERLAKVPGATEIRKDILRQTLGYLRNFAAQAKDNPELRADLALTYSKIGTLSAEIGSPAETIAADKEAIQLFRSLADADPRDTNCRQRLGVCQNNLGLALARSGKTDDARRAFGEAIRLQEDIADIVENREQCLADLALARSNLGLLLNETADFAGAAASLDRAAVLQQQLLAAAPTNPERMHSLAVTLNTQAALHVHRQPAEAVQLYENAADLQKKASALLPDDLVCRNELAMTCVNLGAVQSRQGAAAEAAEAYNRAVELETELVRRAPAEKSYRHTLARACNNLGLVEGRFGRAAAAESSFRQALALQETLVKQDPRVPDLQSDLGGMYNNLGIVLEAMKRPADAIAAYDRAIAQQRGAMEQAPEIAKYRQNLSKHYYNYERVLRLSGRGNDALQAALARRDLWPKDPEHLFAVAEELALAAQELSSRKASSAGVAAEFGTYAVETLKRAVVAGWKPKPNSNWTKPFAAVKNRPEFLALMN